MNSLYAGLEITQWRDSFPTIVFTLTLRTGEMATDAHLDARHDGPDGLKGPKGNTLRVLIVDDDADTSDTMAILLNHWGFEPLAVRSGTEALQVAQSFDPDLVLLDIGMPGMDGLELARRLRAQVVPKGKVPFLVAVSGYGDRQTQVRARDVGIDLHLIKPVDPSYLEKLLQRFRELVMPVAERRIDGRPPHGARVPSLPVLDERATVIQSLKRLTGCLDSSIQLRSRLLATLSRSRRSRVRAEWRKENARFLDEAERLRLLFRSFQRWGTPPTTDIVMALRSPSERHSHCSAVKRPSTGL